jgi:Tol biopolymer transport system component
MRILLFFLFISNQLLAQSFTIEQVLSSPFPTELKASAVGNRVAFVLNEQGSRNLFVYENGKTQKIIQYPKDNGQEISGLIFTNDGNALVFVRGGAPNSVGELPNPTEILEGVERSIFKIDVSGKNLRKISNGFYPKISPKENAIAFLSGGQIWTASLSDTTKKAAKLFQIRGTQGNIRWSPDGNKIAFVSNRTDHSFIGIYDFATKSVKFLSPSVDSDQHPVWSPDGKKIAFIREPHERDELMFGPKREALPYSIMVADVESGESKQLWQAKAGVGSAFWGSGLVAENNLFWTADNYLIFAYEGDGWHHLYSISPNGGTAKLLTNGNGEVEYATYSADKKSVIFNSNIGDIDRRHLWQVSGDGTLKQLTTGKGIEWSPVQTQDGSVYCLHSDATSPAIPAVLKNGALNDISLDFFPKNFPFNQMVEPQSIKITATDGMQIPAQIFIPKNHKAGENTQQPYFFTAAREDKCFWGSIMANIITRHTP